MREPRGAGHRGEKVIGTSEIIGIIRQTKRNRTVRIYVDFCVVRAKKIDATNERRSHIYKNGTIIIVAQHFCGGREIVLTKARETTKTRIQSSHIDLRPALC